MTQETAKQYDFLYHYKAIVISVYDGDSLRVSVDLGMNTWIHNVSLRLNGIDAPEIRGSERPQGLVSRDAVRDWCPVGSNVIIRTVKDRTEKFGRWMADVYPEGWEESINDRLLREGLAERYEG